MERAIRRPMLAAAALTTAGALALSPVTVTPPEMHALDLSPATISTQAVQLTDAWSDLVTNTVSNVVQIGALFIGLNSSFPLPNPIFIAPVATQLLLNPLIYGVQLVTGHGADIPGEILSHLDKIAVLGKGIVDDVIPAIGEQIKTPFLAAQLAFESITTSSNLLLGLLEAPAVFLDAALNSTFGLIGVNGPIAIPIIIRNVLASALYTPLPTITLPFKKPAAAAATPKAVAATVTPDAPSGTASSARSKPKTPASSSRKAASAKASAKGSAGSGHSKRG